jgi:hypothetical protein
VATEDAAGKKTVKVKKPPPPPPKPDPPKPAEPQPQPPPLAADPTAVYPVRVTVDAQELAAGCFGCYPALYHSSILATASAALRSPEQMAGPHLPCDTTCRCSCAWS